MLHWPTAIGFHNPVKSSIKPLISVGLPTPYSTVKLTSVLSNADDVTIVCRNGNLQPIFDEYERLSLLSGLSLNASVLNY